MKNRIRVWACTPYPANDSGEISHVYSSLRSFYANIQKSSTQADAAVYGQYLNEIVKLYTTTAPDLREEDHLYLAEPKPVDLVTIGGEAVNNYGPGDFVVKSVLPSKIGVASPKNPTVITAGAVVRGE